MKNYLLIFAILISFKLSGQSDTTIYNSVRQAEVLPEFKGGTDALLLFISNNTKYPDHLKEKGIQGRAIVRFIITTDGKLVGA